MECSTKEIAFVYARLIALGRIVSVIATFVLWASLTAGTFLLCKSGMASLSDIGSVAQVLSVLGLSPLAMTVLTWRGVEKALFLYLDRYAEKYCRETPS